MPGTRRSMFLLPCAALCDSFLCMQTVDIVIIGGGVVGLAAAAGLAGTYPDRTVVLLERNAKCGQETSSRSSEVIHAGIYYSPGSLRARLCVEGRQLLYEFCDYHGVEHRRIGKLIVANGPAEEATLEELLSRGRANGVEGLELLGRREAQRREPRVLMSKALWSPSTGIIDSHGLTTALTALAIRKGVTIACSHTVQGIKKAKDVYDILHIRPDGSLDSLTASWVINAAGLYAGKVAELAGLNARALGCRLHWCKGEYFRIPNSKGDMVRHLVYPPPYKDLLGLGIHVTKGLDGATRLGPNAAYVDELDYDVDPDHAQEFYDGIKQYLPFLTCGDLQPDTAGIRPKLQGPGEPESDFYIRHEAGRGLPGFINLMGIESPGLTSCLAIGAMVADMVEL